MAPTENELQVTPSPKAPFHLRHFLREKKTYALRFHADKDSNDLEAHEKDLLADECARKARGAALQIPNTGDSSRYLEAMEKAERDHYSARKAEHSGRRYSETFLECIVYGMGLRY